MQSQPGGQGLVTTVHASNHSLEVGLVTTHHASNHSLEVGVFPTLQAITAWRRERFPHCTQSQPGGGIGHHTSSKQTQPGGGSVPDTAASTLEVGVFPTLQAITACRWEWPGQRDLAHPTCVYSLSLSVLLLSPHPPHPSGVLVYRVCASGCKYFLWLN